MNKLYFGDNLDILKQLHSNTYDKIQILTIEDLMKHKTVLFHRKPKTTFKTTQRETIKNNSQKKLFEPEN